MPNKSSTEKIFERARERRAVLAFQCDTNMQLTDDVFAGYSSACGLVKEAEFFLSLTSSSFNFAQGIQLQSTMKDGHSVLGSLYVYAPNKGAPVFFAVAFAASAVGHIWQVYHYKCLKPIGLHSLCAVLFTAGYALREYGAFNYLYSNQNLIIFILSQVLIYVCPPLIELANYHVLGRVFYYRPYSAPLPPGKILCIFGTLLALVETLNALGIAFASNTSSSQNQQELESRLTVAALAIQLSVIDIFVVLAAIFYR